MVAVPTRRRLFPGFCGILRRRRVLHQIPRLIVELLDPARRPEGGHSCLMQFALRAPNVHGVVSMWRLPLVGGP